MARVQIPPTCRTHASPTPTRPVQPDARATAQCSTRRSAPHPTALRAGTRSSQAPGSPKSQPRAANGAKAKAKAAAAVGPGKTTTTTRTGLTATATPRANNRTGRVALKLASYRDTEQGKEDALGLVFARLAAADLLSCCQVCRLWSRVGSGTYPDGTHPPPPPRSARGWGWPRVHRGRRVCPVASMPSLAKGRVRGCGGARTRLRMRTLY